jgi:hypothetical protein
MVLNFWTEGKKMFLVTGGEEAREAVLMKEVGMSGRLPAGLLIFYSIFPVLFFNH